MVVCVGNKGNVPEFANHKPAASFVHRDNDGSLCCPGGKMMPESDYFLHRTTCILLYISVA
jgi:hypothetical protein